MRTVVDTPDGWRELAVDGGHVLAPPGEGADLIVEVEPPSSAPVDDDELRRAILGRVPPGRQVRVVGESAGETACGWPYEVIEALVIDAQQRAIEGRVIVVYRFLARVAVLTVRARRQERLDEVRADVEAVIASARPDWRDGTVAALAELWPGALSGSSTG